MPSPFSIWIDDPPPPQPPSWVISRHEDRMVCEGVRLKFQATEPGTDNCKMCALRRSSLCPILCTDNERTDLKTGYWSGHKVRDP